jgi:hypothetical protein
MLWVPWWATALVRVALVLVAVVGIFAFLKRVVYHLEYAKLTRDHLSFNPLGTARSPG